VSRSVSPTRVVIAVGAVAGALALAGCGAGQITQTSTQVSGVEGGSANVGQIAVRAAEFAFAGDGNTAAIYPSGGTAPLSMTVVNTGALPDRLTAASSPVAGSVTIQGDATISGGRKLLVDGQPAAVTAPATPSAGATAGATRTPSAAPTPEASATPSSSAAPAASGTPEALPSEAAGANSGPTAEGTTSAQVVLTGLKQDLQAGESYPVELTFQRAGAVTVQVPVGNPTEGSSPG
jgi:copper(I)-binding protein